MTFQHGIAAGELVQSLFIENHMFDIFDILVPELATEGIELRHHLTAFGPGDDKLVYVHGNKFAKALKAQDAYTAVRWWTGSEDRASWTVLAAHEQANKAVVHEESWTAFLEALVTVLNAHQFWRVTCESDCDQYPLEKRILSPAELAELLGSHRSTETVPIAVRATPYPDPCDDDE